MMSRYKTVLWRSGVRIKRTPTDLFDLIAWPLLLIIPFGLFTTYTGAGPEVLMVLIIGAIGWITTSAIQRELVINFMIEVWQRTIKKSRVLPIKEIENVTINWMVGIVRGLLTFFIISTVSYFLFGINIFKTNILILSLAFIGIVISSLLIGMFVISTIKIFGHRAEVVAWFITEIIVLVSGIYYSVEILPRTIRTIAYASPLTYVFEILRKSIIETATLAELSPLFVRMFAILSVGVFLVSAFYIYAEKLAIKKGFYQKYD